MLKIFLLSLYCKSLTQEVSAIGQSKSLIHFRLRVQVPYFLQKNIKNNKNYLEVSEIFVIFVLLKFFDRYNGPIAQLVRAADS